MSVKFDHKHDYHRFVQACGSHYRTVNVCSICGHIRDVPFKEQFVKVEGGWTMPLHLEEIKECFGDLPQLPDK